MMGAIPSRSFFRAASAFALAALFIFFIILVPQVRAAALTTLSDVVSSHTAGEGSDHTIRFTTPTGVESSTDTITLTFASGFDLSGISFADVDILHGVTGDETSEAVAATPAAGTWGASISGAVLTLTAPTDAIVGEIAAGDVVMILIGEHATGGTDQIMNPTTPLDYPIFIAGTFGDTGQIGIAVAEDDSVGVSATVPGAAPEPEPEPTPTSTPPTGIPGDITPPVIFNLRVTPDGPGAVLVTWQTNEPANSVVRYGHGLGYASGTVMDPVAVMDHRIRLTGLIRCATYHLVAQSTDVHGNSATSPDIVYTVPCDVTPPAISNIRVVNITDTTAIVLWGTDEPATSVVEYGLTDAYGNTISVPGFVTGHSVPLSGLQPRTTYHFRVISTDPSGNTTVSTDQAFTTLGDVTPPTNPPFRATPGDRRIRLDWMLPFDSDLAGVHIVRRTDRFPSGPNDGVVAYDGLATSHLDTGLTNGTRYYYGAYAYDTSGNFSSGSLASAVPFAGLVPPVPPMPGVTTTPPTPGTTIRIELIGANGTLPLLSAQDGSVGALTGSDLRVHAPASGMNGIPAEGGIVFILHGTTYILTFDARIGAYTARITAPLQADRYPAKGQAVFTDGRVAETTFILNVQGPGRVFERPLFGSQTIPVPDAIIRLYAQIGGTWAPWDAGVYAQQNPVSTDVDGQFAFQVPTGRYYADVRKEGYWAYFGPPLLIDEHVFGPSIELIRLPTPITEVISPTSTPLENVVAVVQNIGQRIEYGLKRFRAWLTSPAIQSLLAFIAAWVLAFMLLNTLSAISLWGALAYVQFLLLWPFVFWHKKDRGGSVYNVLTKRAVDLVRVRLIHAPTGLLVRSRITNREGQYAMPITKPGTYMLKAIKPGFIFPSTVLDRVKEDGRFLGPYYGTRTKITETGLFAPHIPVDPEVSEETRMQVIRRTHLSYLQRTAAGGGLLAGLAIFILAPSLLMAVFVAMEAGAYAVYRRLHVPVAPKRRARIYDESTGKAIQGALVRLRDMKTRTLLESLVTDRHGRYGFVAGQNRYSILVEAPGYLPTELLDLEPQEGEEVIARDIKMARKKRS